MLTVNQGFWYDEETYVEAGAYEFLQSGLNGYAMIKVNGEWLDIINPEFL